MSFPKHLFKVIHNALHYTLIYRPHCSFLICMCRFHDHLWCSSPNYAHHNSGRPPSHLVTKMCAETWNCVFWISSTLSNGSNQAIKKKAKLHEKLEGTNLITWIIFSHSGKTVSKVMKKICFFEKNYRKLSGVTEKCICELLWEVKPKIIKSRKKSLCGLLR